MKLRIGYNGSKYGWGKFRSVLDFFLPYRKWHPWTEKLVRNRFTGRQERVMVRSMIIRREAMTHFIKGRGVVEREFYTFRAFAGHYWYTFLNNLKVLGSIELRVEQLVLAPGITVPVGYHFAIAFDAATNGGGTVGTSQSFAHTVTGSNVALVAVDTGDLSANSDSLTSIAYNGVNLTIDIRYGSSNTARWDYIGDLIGPATGSNNVVVTMSASVNIDCVVASYSGVQARDAVGSGQQTVTSPLTVNVTTVADNSWQVAGGMSPGGISGGSGTLRSTSGQNTALYDAGPLTPAGAKSFTIASSSGLISGGSISIAPGTQVAPILIKKRIFFPQAVTRASRY